MGSHQPYGVDQRRIFAPHSVSTNCQMIAKLTNRSEDTRDVIGRGYRAVLYFLFWYVAVFISRILNLCTGGRFREPVCARVGRNAYVGTFPAPFWRGTANTLDLLFFMERNHCFRAFLRYAIRK